MDNDELFENFNLSSYDTSTKKDDLKLFLSKKRNIEHEQDENSNSKNNIINKYNSEQSKEKKEDLLLSKEIQSIKDSIRTENDNSISKEDTEEINFKINNIPDKEVKIITSKFEGGFHELIYPINISQPKNTIEKIVNPATTYPFKLDQFQEKSFSRYENFRNAREQLEKEKTDLQRKKEEFERDLKKFEKEKKLFEVKFPNEYRIIKEEMEKDSENEKEEKKSKKKNKKKKNEEKSCDNCEKKYEEEKK